MRTGEKKPITDGSAFFECRKASVYFAAAVMKSTAA